MCNAYIFLCKYVHSVLICIGGSYSCMHIFWDIGNYKEAKVKKQDLEIDNLKRTTTLMIPQTTPLASQQSTPLTSQQSTPLTSQQGTPLTSQQSTLLMSQ